MSVNKKIITGFLVIISTISSAMELSKSSQEVKKQSQPIDIIPKASEDTSYITVPTSWSGMFNAAKNMGSSALETVVNFASNEAALRKLGLPISDINAQEELKKSHALYLRMIEALQSGITYNTYAEDCKALNRRIGFIDRIVNDEIPSNDSALSSEMAFFLERNHQQFISYINELRLCVFWKNKKPMFLSNDDTLLKLEKLKKSDPVILKQKNKQLILQKLGWPTDDKIAQQKLEKINQIYERLNRCSQTKNMYDGFVKDSKKIEKIHNYCCYVINLILENSLKRADIFELTSFCLKNHGQVMHDIDKTKILVFGEIEKDKSAQEVKKFDSELATLKIIPEDNDLLNNLLEYTVKEKQKKEEEEKKRKEEEDKKKSGKK